MSNAVTYTQSPFNKSRKDKFLLVLNIPAALRNIASKFERNKNTIIPDSLQFSVYGSVVPDIKVPSASVRYAGQTLAQSSHSREPFPPLTVNFTIDNRFNNYWVIYKWLNMLNNDSKSGYDQEHLTVPTASLTNPDSNTPNYQYRATISIFALDEYNKRIVEFVYKDAFPTNLGGISYSYRDGAEIETDFTFEYSQLIVAPVTDIESL
jgi:hypothetical protein